MLLAEWTKLCLEVVVVRGLQSRFYPCSLDIKANLQIDLCDHALWIQRAAGTICNSGTKVEATWEGPRPLSSTAKSEADVSRKGRSDLVNVLVVHKS